MNTEPGRPVAIAILAKAPIPGLTKTRLIPHLGAEGAAELQSWFLERTLTTALAASIGPVFLWCAPDANHPDFLRHSRKYPLTLHVQLNGDLGERMYQAIAASSTAHGTLVIGTDCPVLTTDHLRTAASALQSHDVVITPAEDGGYVLIGLRSATRVPFFEDMPWSTDRLMTETRQRLAASDLSCLELSPLWDVDRKEDFERLLTCFPELTLPNRRTSQEAVASPLHNAR